jgi:hypothetical protein
VEVIAHQHGGQWSSPIPLDTLLQPFDKLLPVLLATEKRLPLIAPGGDMVKGSGEFGYQSSHRLSILIFLNAEIKPCPSSLYINLLWIVPSRPIQPVAVGTPLA